MVRVPPKIGCRFSSGCPRRFPCKPGAGIAPLRIACRLSGCDRPCVRAVRDVSARRFAGLREGRSADLGEAAELVRVGRARRARGEAPPPHRRSCPRRLGVSYGNRLGDTLVLARHAWGLRPPFASPECTDRRVVKNGLNQSKRYYVADLYWPEARFAVEYDSDRWHVGPERIGQDAARRNALLFQGVNVVTVCSQQIMSESKMDDVARIAARALGRSVRPRAREWRKRNRELRRAVLPHRVDGSGECW